MESVRITRFGGDLVPNPQEFQDLEVLIESCDDLYPGIDIWYKKKVLPDLDSKDRTAYVLYSDDRPAGAAVLRLDNDPKICSFRVLPDAESKGLGKLLMALLARDVRNRSDSIHFTIPAHIWEDRSPFFEQYGFKCKGPTRQQYRLFDKEFYCRGKFDLVWQKVLQTLPDLLKSVTINGFAPTYDLVMSVHPRFAEPLVSGKKRIEIRRRFSTKWKGAKTLVYSSSPESSFVGSFRISNVYVESPKYIWENFRSEIHCSQEDYRKYTLGCNRVYAIEADDHHQFHDRIPAWQVSQLLKRDFRAPQAYGVVKDNSMLTEIGSISALLQATSYYLDPIKDTSTKNSEDKENTKSRGSDEQLTFQL